MRILIVEDEEALANLVSDRLKKEKYSTDICLDGEEGCYNALLGIYDLIILDIMLPYKNGIEILKEIRNNNINSKVIMLTAKSEIDDKLLGFNEGANDYITKPFHIDEVVARVNALLRTSSARSNTLEFEDIILDLKACTLINKELQLLEYFISNPRQILSKEMIYDKIWGLDNESFSNNLEAYLSFIRKKLKLIGSNTTIKSVRNLGYKMEVLNEGVK